MASIFNKMWVTSFSAYFIVIVIIALTGQLCSSDDGQDNLKKLATASNELALNLYERMSASSSENVFFSPLSISTVFGMLFYGARGDTAKELRKVLGYEKAELSDELVHTTFKRLLSEVLNRNESSSEYVLNDANAAVVDENLELVPGYRNAVEDLYQALVLEVNFKSGSQAVEVINNWVNEKTKGKIPKLVDMLPTSTALVLLNAVYFKGTWRIQFQKNHTIPQKFFNEGLESEAKDVPMMHLTESFGYSLRTNYQALELPYKGGNISMVLLLPYRRDGLQELETTLTVEELATIQNELKQNTTVGISLPKFQIEYSKELSSDFQALGATRIFDADVADFSGMTPSKISVSQVLHKAEVEVNEEGSEAAAVTGIVTVTQVVKPPTPQFIADHPFLFTILEKGSGMVLFMGRVNKM